MSKKSSASSGKKLILRIVTRDGSPTAFPSIRPGNFLSLLLFVIIYTLIDHRRKAIISPKLWNESTRLQLVPFVADTINIPPVFTRKVRLQPQPRLAVSGSTKVFGTLYDVDLKSLDHNIMLSICAIPTK